MRYRARASAQLGSLWDAFGGAGDALADAGYDSVVVVKDAVSDAGDEIGAALKLVAPVIALWPGIGTAVSIALSAAAAYACGDPIDQAAVDIASNAIPGGVPRVVFNTGADVTRTALRGGDVKAAAIRGMRSVASSAGGERAVAAFDTGVAVARGEKIKDASWRLARENAKSGGAATLAAFDAGTAVANGGDAEDVILAAARSYAVSAGGPLVAAAFDGGLAIARGQSLQDAGFAALKGFVAGNDLGERSLAFASAMVRAARKGESVKKVLADELVADVDRYGAALARSGAVGSAKDAVAKELGPVLERWPDLDWLPGFDTWGSYALAEALGVVEEIARAAQAVMRDGTVDQPLLERLTKTGVQNAIEKYGAGVVASKVVNRTYAETKGDIREERLLSVATMPTQALSYATAKSEQAPAQAASTPVVKEIEHQAAPSSPRNGVASDVALGGVVAAAAVALFFWAKS